MKQWLVLGLSALILLSSGLAAGGLYGRRQLAGAESAWTGERRQLE